MARTDNNITIAADEFRKRFPALGTRITEDARLARLLAALALRRVERGATLCTRREPADTLYLVWHGRLALSAGDDAQAVALGEIGPGRWIGEIALIEPGPAVATVRASADSSLLTLSHAALARLRAEAPETARTLLHALSLDLAERLRLTSSEILVKSDAAAPLMLVADARDRGWMQQLLSRLAGGAPASATAS